MHKKNPNNLKSVLNYFLNFIFDAHFNKGEPSFNMHNVILCSVSLISFYFQFNLEMILPQQLFCVINALKVVTLNFS